MPYVNVPDINEGEGEDGRGERGGSSNKKLTKQQFMMPMERLASSLKSLNQQLVKYNCAVAREKLMNDVTNQFVEIGKMVGYTAHPNYNSDDGEDEYDSDNTDGHGEERKLSLLVTMIQIKTVLI